MTSTLIPALPEGTHRNATICRVSGGKGITLVAIDGKVYCDRHYSLDMATSYLTNDHVRRAYCRLSGVKLNDLRTAVKAQQKKNDEIRQSDHMHRLQREAAKIGYELRRIG